ncbi:hypothetical protein GN109_07885 [Collimonas pratensis]|uniref:hypothetical protein n=1 Tax=Collimonas pratensis TaxID=279113 RepID=UPI00143CCCBD|nr:hypothetical protein [Collimonas pratensis]NKI69334.1 hypothetical protein [Collimonas pratensis]
MTVTTTIDWGVQQIASLQRSIAGCGKPGLVRMEQLTGKSGRKILEAMMSGELPYPHRALLAPRVHVVINYLLEVFSKDDFLHVSLKKLQSYVA